MNNTFCLSFSDIGFQLLHVVLDDSEKNIYLNQQFNYPSPVTPDQIFNGENVAFISNSIYKFKTENNIEDFSLSFAIPFTYADIKKVALPLNSDKTQKRKQIEWELKTTLPGELKDYKISVLNESDESNFSTAVVVAIKKALIVKLKYIADENKCNIQNVFLSPFALENYILHDNRYSEDKNFAFIKVSKKIIEYHFFCGKQYYLSQIDSLDLLSRSKEEVVLELTHERYKSISNLFGQTLNENPFELFLYGCSLSDEIFTVLKKGLSIPVEYAHIDNFPANEDFKYIEAWGSIL